MSTPCRLVVSESFCLHNNIISYHELQLIRTDHVIFQHSLSINNINQAYHVYNKLLNNLSGFSLMPVIESCKTSPWMAVLTVAWWSRPSVATFRTRNWGKGDMMCGMVEGGLVYCRCVLQQWLRSVMVVVVEMKKWLSNYWTVRRWCLVVMNIVLGCRGRITIYLPLFSTHLEINFWMM